jgi:DHA2 family multidrug resistance protein-like MFS transporter
VPLQPDWDPLDLAWRLGIVGVGLGLFNGPNQTAIIAATAAGEQATASAASGLARSLAFSAGPLLATTAWAMSDYQARGMRIGLGFAVALCLAAALLAAGVLHAHHSEQAAVAPSAARSDHAISAHAMAA